jgi:hypothetical protein
MLIVVVIRSMVRRIIARKLLGDDLGDHVFSIVGETQVERYVWVELM